MLLDDKKDVSEVSKETLSKEETKEVSKETNEKDPK